MRKLLLAVAVLAIVGCARQLINPNVSEAQASQDTQQCKYQASRDSASMGDEVARAFRMNDLVGECLRMKGYR